jgi:hypothetical protein
MDVFDTALLSENSLMVVAAGSWCSPIIDFGQFAQLCLHWAWGLDNPQYVAI